MKTIFAVVITAGLTIPFSFMAGTLVFGHRIRVIETAEKQPLPKTAHFNEVTANSIQLVDDQGRERISLYQFDGYAAIKFYDYFENDYMEKMCFYSYGKGQLAGMQIDSPPGQSMYDYELTSDVNGPRIIMHKNDTMFNLNIVPDEIDMNINNLSSIKLTPFGISKKP